MKHEEIVSILKQCRIDGTDKYTFKKTLKSKDVLTIRYLKESGYRIENSKRKNLITVSWNR